MIINVIAIALLIFAAAAFYDTYSEAKYHGLDNLKLSHFAIASAGLGAFILAAILLAN